MTAISNNTKIFGKMSNKSKIRFKQQNLVLLVSNSVFKLAKLSSYEFSCRMKELLILHGSNFLLFE